jgi:hypothetical protein
MPVTVRSRSNVKAQWSSSRRAMDARISQSHTAQPISSHTSARAEEAVCGRTQPRQDLHGPPFPRQDARHTEAELPARQAVCGEVRSAPRRVRRRDSWWRPWAGGELVIGVRPQRRSVALSDRRPAQTRRRPGADPRRACALTKPRTESRRKSGVCILSIIRARRFSTR